MAFIFFGPTDFVLFEQPESRRMAASSRRPRERSTDLFFSMLASRSRSYAERLPGVLTFTMRHRLYPPRALVGLGGGTVLQDESTRPRLPRRQGERACRRSACMGALRCSSGGLPHCGICYRPPTPRVGPKARLIRVRALCDQAAEVGAPLFGAVRSDSRGWFQCARGCSAGSLSDSWFHNSTPTIRAPDRA